MTGAGWASAAATQLERKDEASAFVSDSRKAIQRSQGGRSKNGPLHR